MFHVGLNYLFTDWSSKPVSDKYINYTHHPNPLCFLCLHTMLNWLLFLVKMKRLKITLYIS